MDRGDLLRAITDAFPKCSGVSAEEKDELRISLISYTGEPFQIALGVVLSDLLSQHCEQGGRPESAEDVVWFLDPTFPPFEGEADVDARTICAAKLAEFNNLNLEQALVIRNWLAALLSWPEYNRFKRDISSALSYWDERVKSNRSVE